LNKTFDGLPLVISWELTLECNLRCSHCGSSAGTPRIKELSLEESISICNQFPDLLVQEVNFTGGEPTINVNFLKIAKHLQEFGILTQVITNGLTLKPDLVAKMKDAGIAAVGVSIDGLERTHDRIRDHEGLFRQVLAGIGYVREADLPLTVLTTANAKNLNELPDLVELLISCGINRWQIQPIFPFGRGHENPQLQLNAEQYLQLGSFIKDWKSQAENAGLKIELADSYGYFTEFDKREPVWKGCPAGLVACGITSDGKIKGCLSLPDDKIEGDLRKNSLWDIWFNPNSFSYTRGFSNVAVGSNCEHCDNLLTCKGGCSAMSYGFTGKFHNDPFCFLRILAHSR
jgi:radical SAM protein with 4Fe4S-binding SPASM domain